MLDMLEDGLAFADFRMGGESGKGRGGKQSEAKRFMAALRRQCERQGKELVTTSELYSLADQVGLQARQQSHCSTVCASFS